MMAAGCILNRPPGTTPICQLYDVGPNYLVMEFLDGAPITAPDTPRKLLDLAGESGIRNLDGDDAVEARVPGSVHLAHAAGSDGSEDFVGA
jgi:hypothetical protein